MKTKQLQAKYSAEKKKALELLKKIERAILDEPTAAPDYGYLGSLQYVTSELQDIADFFCSEGEYAE